MLQVALLCLLLGSGHSSSVSRDTFDKNEESSGETLEEDDFSISTLLEKANKNLGKRPTDPVIRELDIAVGYGLQNADPCTATGCMWPKSHDGKVYVPYRISNQYSKKEKDIIEDGLRSFAKRQFWRPVTCIRFIPQTTQQDFLFILSDNGCYSMVGKRNGTQVVSLQRPGCLYKHTIQHELMHALGFEHEHSRSDRDQHVRIQLQNVIRGMKHNFDKVQTNNLRTPYDYKSVMQYGRNFFSKNGQPTILPIPDPNVAIGTAKKMSNNDILRIKRLYNCCTYSPSAGSRPDPFIEGASDIKGCK